MRSFPFFPYFRQMFREDNLKKALKSCAVSPEAFRQLFRE
jgi:hypothetical protein